MRLVAFFCLLLLLLAPVGRVAAADSKYALVIGNAKYPDSESPLKEPVNDMRAMADELKRAGFEVTAGENLSGDAMRRAIAGPAPEGSPLADTPLSGYTNAELAGLLLVTTVGLVVVSQWFYRWSLRKAWRNGKLEETTGV